jgi:tripartite-type tricarboxylate transporter receptor subunit TctC
MRKCFVFTIILLTLFILPLKKIFADTIEQFYKDKTVIVVVRSTPGGSYDAYARLVARHIGKYISGNPNVIVQNRPGAGGIVASNYMQFRAPQDGTVIALFDASAALAQRSGKQGVEYDISTWNLLGSIGAQINAYAVRQDSEINSFSDLLKSHNDYLFSTAGPGSSSYYMAEFLSVAKMPVKTITGYVSNEERILAILRGEVLGSVVTTAQKTLESSEIKIIGLVGDFAELDHLEQLRDFIPDESKDMFDVYTGPFVAGRPFTTTPGVPKERVQVLQHALAQVINDSEFLAEAKKLSLDINYVTPEKMKSIYNLILSASDEVIDKFNQK